MTLDNGFLFTVGSTLLIVGSAWGDLRRRVNSNQVSAEERHAETTGSLKEIKADVRRINGQVIRHTSEIEALKERK